MIDGDGEKRFLTTGDDFSRLGMRDREVSMASDSRRRETGEAPPGTRMLLRATAVDNRLMMDIRRRSLR